MLHRAKLDKNQGLTDFCNTLEKTIIDTVEGGVYTKDLAISVLGKNDVPRDSYVNTEDFISAVAKNLDK